jgi:hypothetical protein
VFGVSFRVHTLTARTAVAPYHLRSVVAYRFDGTTFHCFFAKSFFFRRLRLFINVRMTAVIVPFEIGRRSFAAQIAIDALIIDVELARYVFGIFVRGIGHGFRLKNEVER